MFQIFGVLNILKMSTSSSINPASIAKKKVSQHMTLHTITKDANEAVARGQQKTLVIMFPFLQAPSVVISHYCDLYHNHGYDVLTVSGQLKHFLWPPSGVTVAHELLDYLASNELPLSTSSFYIHASSLGAYIYALVMMELNKKQVKYASIEAKIQAQIFDSLVIGGFDQMTASIAQVIKSPVAQTTFHMTKPYTKDIMLAAVDHFKLHPIQSPILLYYCLNDVISSAKTVQEMVENWQCMQLSVHVKCWEQSDHARHLIAHPRQYKNTLDAFLTYVQNMSVVTPSKF